MSSLPPPTRRKVAVLGGGMSGLTAALELTSDPSWRDHYDVTVYQIGWRLGGKCASGRNAKRNYRIEEHGLHVWFGCYKNAFRLLRGVYNELKRPASPFRTIEQAFRPMDSTPVGEFVAGTWRVWPVNYPPNQLVPGEGDESPVWENLKHLIAFADSIFADLPSPSPASPPAVPARRWSSVLWPRPPAVEPGDGLLRQCHRLVHAEAADPLTARRGLARATGPLQRWRYRRAALSRLRTFKQWAREHPTELFDDEARRKWVAIDLAITIAIGFLVDGVLFCGTDVIDEEDLRGWLRRHGALESSIWSGPVQALYDLCFAFDGGDAGAGRPDAPGRPNFAAGSALEIALRIGLTYSGSVCYEMQAGMGEVVIAPIYQVLRDRGVRFEFFHKVKKLRLSPDGKSVAGVEMERQVRLKNGTYSPLIQVKDLDCWPNEPLFDQIEQGDSLRGHDLESHWTTWTGGEKRVLEANVDFDEVILATSLGPLKEICEELIHTQPKWRKMINAVPAVQTLSAQLWTEPALEELGWDRGRVPVDAAPEPLDVWSDMTQFVSREEWPADGPRAVQFLCGPLVGDFASRPATDTTVPTVARQLVHTTVQTWLEQHGRDLWPNAAGRSPASPFDWDVLHDPTGTSDGPSRLCSQYLRANINPSDLYVQSPAGSTRYRLRPNDSGCRNLLLAGDWTRTPFNAGCIEAATMSGLAAARALTGRQAPSELSLFAPAKLLIYVARKFLCLCYTIVRQVLRFAFTFRTRRALRKNA